ncbi:MAG TPA: hypothetical protein VMF55_09080 [Solirubrobacterales bacterium]|nr:hypothetical protein [Solirubrobacterales bacterium]
MNSPNANTVKAVRKLLLMLVAFAVGWASMAGQAGAAPAAAWHLSLNSLPTNLPPGADSGSSTRPVAPVFETVASNVGGASTSGEVKIVDSLPAGITASENAPATIKVYVFNIVSQESCAVSTDRRTVTCATNEALPPGGQAVIDIPLNISSDIAGSTVINTVSVSGGGAGDASTSLPTLISAETPPFGFLPGAQGIAASVAMEDGSPASQAGSTPFSLTLRAGFPVAFLPEGLIPGGGAVRNLSFSFPSGLVINPRLGEMCAQAQFGEETGGIQCPASSQVGTVEVGSSFGRVSPELIGEPLYALEPAPGVPAELGFEVGNVFVRVQGGLDGQFHLVGASREILQKIPIWEVRLRLWGNPSDPRHNPERVGPSCPNGGCAVEFHSTPFITMPTACSEPLEISATAAPWDEAPDREAATASTNITGPEEVPFRVTGCGRLAFAPAAQVRPTSVGAESPTGLVFHLHIPQTSNVSGLATAALKKVKVDLPVGMTVNSAAATGLSACNPLQIAIGSSAPADCPDASKVGTAEVLSPLLASPLKGSLYLASQKSNPFGTLLALYLVVEGEGIVVKLPGRVDADPVTGRLTVTFDNNPQLPFTDLTVTLNSGPRAALVTPPSCGTYGIKSELTSWASAVPVAMTSSFSVNEGCSGGGFAPKLQAGAANPVAGRFSSFTLRVTREPGEQNLARIVATLPRGLVAKLAEVPLCPDAQAVSGDCPVASQVGTTNTGVGSGPSPLYIPEAGKAPTALYLAGPYHGAPYSLVAKVPAQAGPFDLGVITVRVALEVDPFSAEVTATSDPLPQILEGIPITYRDLRVEASRPEFVVNPTSCEPMQITSSITSIAGAYAHPQSHFQVAGCESLAFKPSLKISLKGATKRTGHPALKAVVTYPKKGLFANIARAQVNLPHSEFLDQGNLNKTCTKPVLLEGKCPKSSVYGRVKAWTPLLEKPLQGRVYLVGGFGYKLPALIAELNGQIRILLKGKIDTGPNGGIRNTFEAVPDAAVSRFVLQMKGGKKYSLLENSENLCKEPQRGQARFTAQSGKVEQLNIKIANSCRDKKKK